MAATGGAPVVVGVNGTAASLAAVRLAAREAVARDRELRVVHAFTWPGDGAYPPARRGAARLLDDAVRAARRTTPGVRVRGTLVDGPPTRTLVQASRAAALLVVGDDDLTTRPRPPADSVLVQTVSRARCPVMVVRGTRPPAGPMLAAVDGSAMSLRAARLAAAEARCRGAALELVHVAGDGPDAAAAGRRVLERAAAEVPALRGLPVRLLTGPPAQALVRASRQARMMFVGARGVDGDLLLGRVARELLHHSACPTLFLHGGAAEPRRATDPAPAEALTLS